MKSRATLPALLTALAALICAVPHAAAADAKDKAIQKLRQLHSSLQKLKTAGQVGETDTGTVAAVKDQPLSKAAARIVALVNANRQILYQAIAAEQNVPVEHVARLGGRRNWRRAQPGEWFRNRGKWIQKE